MTTPIGPRENNKLVELQRRGSMLLQRYLDKSVPHTYGRWASFGGLLLLYFVRVLTYGGFYIVTYGMCIHILYLLVLFLTPLDTNQEEPQDDAMLANKAGDEFKPFVPKVQEFKVWWGMTRVVLICFALTLFPFLDIPVFWPILVIYFIILFVSQVSGRIKHMKKFKYVPWDRSKPRYVAKE
jgi:Na+/H+ antiporter NhaD/arsenite permease-like protein